MMIRYFIGLTVPKELGAAITTVRRQLGAMGEAAIKRCEPHLTLVIPFEVDRSIGEIERNFQITLPECNLKPFRLTTNGFGSFLSRVWYVGIAESKPLQALHQRLTAAIRTLTDYQFAAEPRSLSHSDSTDRPYRPHLTIVSRLDRASFQKVASTIDRASLLPTTWTVDAITFYRYAHDHWERDHEILFSK